jgi:hypothetical protein
VARTYHFTYQGHYPEGVQVVTGLHYQTDVPLAGSEPNASDVLDGIDGKLRTAFLGCCHSTFVVDSAGLREEVTKASGAIPVAASKVVNLPGTVSSSAVSLPDALCAIIKLRSDAAARSARGYMAMPCPLAAGFLSGSKQWTGTFYTALQTFAALLDDAISAGSFAPTILNPVVYSRTRHERGFTPYTFRIVEAIPRQDPRWRRSRTTAP